MRNKAGVYATHMFTEEAIKKINAHDVNKPMFLYLAHQAVHSANKNDPLQAPDDLIKVTEVWSDFVYEQQIKKWHQQLKKETRQKPKKHRIHLSLG